jgi:hypothetical protein
MRCSCRLPVSLILTSGTPEALIVAMAENSGRIALFSDESSIFGIVGGRYSRDGSVDLDVFLHGHCGGMLRIKRVSRDTPDIDHARLTMGLAVQPSALDELTEARYADGRGLLGRFLFSFPPVQAGQRVYGQQQKLDEQVEFNFAARVELLAGAVTPQSPVDIGCSQDALQVLTKFANKHEARLAPGTGDLAHIGSWSGKYVGTVLRIAGFHGRSSFDTGPSLQAWTAPSPRVGRLCRPPAQGNHLQRSPRPQAHRLDLGCPVNRCLTLLTPWGRYPDHRSGCRRALVLRF